MNRLKFLAFTIMVSGLAVAGDMVIPAASEDLQAFDQMIAADSKPAPTAPSAALGRPDSVGKARSGRPSEGVVQSVVDEAKKARGIDSNGRPTGASSDRGREGSRAYPTGGASVGSSAGGSVGRDKVTGSSNSSGNGGFSSADHPGNAKGKSGESHGLGKGKKR